MERYYRVLGLPLGASVQQVKSSYRKLVMKYHPDVDPSPEAKERFLEVQNAYEMLTDTDRRGQQESATEDYTGPIPKGNKYKRGTSSRKSKEYFDPENYRPNYVRSYVTTDDADFFCIMRLFLTGFLGLLASIYLVVIGSDVLEYYHPSQYVPAFFIVTFLLFDIFLIWDLRFLGTRDFHAYIVKITEDRKKGLFSFYMSIDEVPSSDFSGEIVRSSSRYRNYLYANKLEFDYDNMPNFVLQRSVFFRVCLGAICFNKYEHQALPWFLGRKRQLLLQAGVLLALGVGMLLLIHYVWTGMMVVSMLYFLYHFYFIRTYMSSNKVD